MHAIRRHFFARPQGRAVTVLGESNQDFAGARIMLKTVLLAMVVLIAGTQKSFGEALWTNPITGTNPNTANPYTTGQVVFAGLTVSGIGRGMGINGDNANDRYSAKNWNTTVLGINNYFTLKLTPDAGNSLNLLNFVYTGQASGTGPTAFAFRSSIDTFASDIGTPTATGATISLLSGSFQNLSSATEFRLYGWGASGSTGTFSVNDFAFNGSITAVPEPSSIALVGLMCCAGFAAAFRHCIAKSKIA